MAAYVFSSPIGEAVTPQRMPARERVSFGAAVVRRGIPSAHGPRRTILSGVGVDESLITLRMIAVMVS